MKLSKAQAENVRWLLSRYGDDSFGASALMERYEAKAKAEHEADKRVSWGWHATTNRRHAWRRTSGRVMQQMTRAGMLEVAGWDRYTQRFKVTAEARAAVEQA